MLEFIQTLPFIFIAPIFVFDSGEPLAWIAFVIAEVVLHAFIFAFVFAFSFLIYKFTNVKIAKSVFVTIIIFILLLEIFIWLTAFK